MPWRLPVVILCVAVFFAAQATTPSEVEITAEPSHHLALENQYVRVFKVEVPPHAATLMHRHRHDYVFVTLGAALISNEVAGKSPVTLSLKDGEVHVSDGGFAHIARNLVISPFRNVTIELMQGEKAPNSPPPKWDEESTRNVLQNGTQQILFVKDGVRVSRVELQTAGSERRHHHAGPLLLVALTDLELRNDVVGQGASNLEMKPGDIKWVEGQLTHSVTNVGKQEAKVVMLEFP